MQDKIYFPAHRRHAAKKAQELGGTLIEFYSQKSRWVCFKVRLADGSILQEKAR